jgi:hypothetical protein
VKTALCCVLLLAASPVLAVEPTVDPTLRFRDFESLSQWVTPMADYSYGVMLREPHPDDSVGYVVENCGGFAEAPYPYLSPDRVLTRIWMEPGLPGLMLNGRVQTSFYLPMLPQ